jgi:hypothetical protein
MKTVVNLLTGTFSLLATAASAQPGPPSGGPVTWPPTSSQCVRHVSVPFYSATNSIGQELTRLYSDPHCSTPPACRRQGGFTTRSFPDAAAASILWDGRGDHSFTRQEQDAIGNTARSYALSRRSAGTQLYKITFSQDVFVEPRLPRPAAGRVFATAFYARCLAGAPR